MDWAEQRAASLGVVLPYQQDGFQPESVAPVVSMAPSSGASSSAQPPIDDAGPSFDLPPLQQGGTADEPADDAGDEYDGDDFDG